MTPSNPIRSKITLNKPDLLLNIVDQTTAEPAKGAIHGKKVHQTKRILKILTSNFINSHGNG